MTCLLALHLAFCEWAAEQWHWYINNLKDQFQDTSRRTLTAPITIPSSPVTAKDNFHILPRTDTPKTSASIAARISRTSTILIKKLTIADPKPLSPVQRTYTDPDSGLGQPLPPHITMNNSPDPGLPSSQPAFVDSEEQDFSSAKLQKLQHIEEKTHKALLILKLNISIIRQLEQYYNAVIKLKNFPQRVVQLCHDDLEQFELRVNGVFNDLDMRIFRLKIPVTSVSRS